MQLVVLGALGSGASTVARLLGASGAYVACESRVAGSDIRALCDHAFQTLGVDWWRPSTLRPDALRRAELDSVRLRARPILDELNEHAPWVIEEPHLCLLLPLFRPLLDSPIVVHVTRHPVDVARILWEERDLPLPMGLALWEVHRLSAIRAAERLPSLTVSFDELMAAPENVARGLVERLTALGVAGLDTPDARVVYDAVRAEHPSVRPSETELDALLTQSQRALLDGTALTSLPRISRAALESLSTLEDREETIEVLGAELDRGQHELRAARDALRVANIEAKMARRQVRKLESSLARPHRRVREMKRALRSTLVEAGDRFRQIPVDRLRSALQGRREAQRNPKVQNDAPSVERRVDHVPAIDRDPRTCAEGPSRYHALLHPLLDRRSHAAFTRAHARSETFIARCLGEQIEARPLVSVVMPTYNRARLVGEAIESVLRQSYEHLELIVCDDGSTDGTVEALARIDDPRLRVIAAIHGGAARARNLALAEARGELIAYLDSDNVWHPAHLDTMVRQLTAHPGRLLAYAKYVDVEITDRGSTLEKAHALPFDYEALSDKNFIDLNTVVHRRALYEYFGGFDESLVRQQDWDLLLKYTYLMDPLYVDAFLALYRRNEEWDQITYVQQHVTTTQDRIFEKVSRYHEAGLPFALPKGPRPSVTVLSWDICRNHFSKAYSVAEVLARSHEVQLLGFRLFEEGLFEPFRDETPTFHTTYLEGAPFPELRRQMADAVRRIRGDVVYAVKPRLTSLGVALLANHHFGTPIVLEHNDLESVVTNPGAGDSVEALTPSDVDLTDPDLENPYGQTWSRLMQHFAQGVPVTTTHNRNLDRFFGERSFFVRNPKDDHFYDPARYDRAAIRAELGFHPSDRVILFGGMLRRHKGIEALVELVRRLGPSYQAIFSGSGDNRHRQRLEESSAGPQVRFLGPRNRNEMARINLAADLVVLWLDPLVPAAHYQMPYKLTDALAMNVPVIANDISDLGELAQRGAIRLCPYGDFGRLEKVVRDLSADDVSRTAMVATGRRLYMRQFSYSALERLLPIVVDRARARPGVLPVAEEFADFWARWFNASCGS